MKTINKTIYVAADGSKHDTLDAAVQREVCNLFEDNLSESESALVTHAVMAKWSTLVTIMDQLDAQVVPVEEDTAELVQTLHTLHDLATVEAGLVEDTPQARLEARRKRVAAQLKPLPTWLCCCGATNIDFKAACACGRRQPGKAF